MENVSLIAAIGRNNELGRDNGLIWQIPGDLKFFKDINVLKLPDRIPKIPFDILGA